MQMHPDIINGFDVTKKPDFIFPPCQSNAITRDFYLLRGGVANPSNHRQTVQGVDFYYDISKG
jgi:hypothetical protein